jgi:hypothetical protein
MSVYVIASLTIKDTVRFEDYRRMPLPTVAKYGGRLVGRGGPIVLEGEWPRERLRLAVPRLADKDGTTWACLFNVLTGSFTGHCRATAAL